MLVGLYTSREVLAQLGVSDFEALKKTFSLSVVIHIFTALLVFVLGETVGLWFLNTQLVIPEERMEAANFAYQFSVLSACVGILQVPYMVAINAHERMRFGGGFISFLYLAVVSSSSISRLPQTEYRRAFPLRSYTFLFLFFPP